MPQVSSGNQELVNQILALAQILGQRKDKQARNILDLAQPGQTAGQIGLTPGLSKRALGRELASTDVVKPHTAQSRADEAESTFLDAVKNNPSLLENAKPGDLLTLGASIFGSRVGQPGITTPKAIRTRAETSEISTGVEKTKVTTQGAVARSISQRVEEGIRAMDAAPEEARAALGQNLAYGTTASNLMSDELKARLAAEATKRGIQFTADPNNHPLGKEFRKLGIDPIAAVAAIGTGSLGFLDNVARLSIIHAQSSADYGSALRSAQAAWAGRLSESIGGKLSPQTIISVMDRRMAGKPPLTDGSGALAERLISDGMEMAYRAAVSKATQEGDPTLGAFKEIVSAAGNIKDDKRFESIANEYRRRSGVLLQSIGVGPRPLEAGPAQAVWDQSANALGGFAPDIKQNKNWRDWANTILAFPAGDPSTGPFRRQTPTLTPGGAPAPLPPTVPAAAPDAATTSIQNMSDADKQNVMMFMQAMGIMPQGQQPPTP
jgi:hypothetical protein